jgi:hypothetical protein
MRESTMNHRRERRRALDNWLAVHHGVAARSNLMQMGFTDDAIRHLLDTEQLVPMTRGVYRSPQHPTSRSQTLTAVCLAHPCAAIAFTTAGQEWGLRRMSDPRIHVLVPHAMSPELPDVVVHRCRRIDPVDIAWPRPDGVRLTSPPRTIFDAASIIGRDATVSVIEQVLQEGRCGFGLLLRTNERLFHPRRPGTLTFDEALMSKSEWQGNARSDLEVRFIQAIVRRGLPVPAINALIDVGEPTPVEVDLSWAPYRVIGEVDHPFWHLGAEDARRDKRRDRRLAALGWLTVRFDQADIDVTLDQSLDELANVLRERGRMLDPLGAIGGASATGFAPELAAWVPEPG